MRAVVLAAALLLASAPAALGQQSTSASAFTLRDVAATPKTPLLVDGINWRCNADNLCTGSGGQSQPAERACRRIVARLGAPLASFTYKGTALSPEDLATCNQAAPQA